MNAEGPEEEEEEEVIKDALAPSAPSEPRVNHSRQYPKLTDSKSFQSLEIVWSFLARFAVRVPGLASGLALAARLAVKKVVKHGQTIQTNYS